MGIRIPGSIKGDAVYDTAKRLMRDAAGRRLWTQSSGNWAWWNYIQRLEAGEADLDDYAVRQVEGLVGAWKGLDSEISGR
jgi:hypothetical protein